LYLEGAARQAVESGLAPAPAARGHDWTKGLPPRAEFVAAGDASRTPAAWGELWDRMDAKLKGGG
jgi:hypothetical protein